MSISLADLKATVRAGVSGDDFSLNAAQLASPDIDAVSANLFPGGTLRLTGVGQPAESSDGNTITVSGTGVDLPFAGMAVEAQFFLDGGNAALALTATGNAVWKLQQSFPVLATSVLAAFSFLPASPPRLRLDSRGNADASAALTFQGLLDLNAASAGLAGLIGRTEQSLSGSADVQKHGAVLTEVALTAPVSEQVNLIIVTVERLTFTVGSDLIYNAVDDKFSAIPYVQLGAEFPFSAQGQDHSLPIAVRVADFGRDFRFSADLTSAISAGLQELSKLTNDVGIGGFIPPDFHLEDVVTLSDFFFDFKTAAPAQVTLVGVDVRSVTPWKILHLDASNKDLQAENVRLAFRLRDPFGAKQPWLSLSGDVRLGDAGVLEISAFYPNFAVTAALKEGTVLRFDELIREFVGADASIPAINVYALLFKVSAGQFSLLADLEGFWAIGDSPVAVEGVRLEIENGGGETRAAVSGTFSVAGVEVSLSASYLGSAGGWVFEGSTGPGQQLPIGELITELVEKFGQMTLPAAVSDLVVENLKVRFDTGQKEFSFGCESKFRADDTDVDITVDLTVKNVNGAYTKDFSGTLKVGGRDFTLHFVQNAASDFFVATYRPDVAGQTQDVKQLVASVSAAVADYVPEGLTIELKDILFAYGKDAPAGAQGGTQAAASKFIFGLDIGTGINLSNLPLVGKEFPPDATVGVDDLQILFISKGLTASDLDSFNRLIPDGVTKLPVPAPPQPAGDTSGTAAVVLQQGFNVSAQMNFGGSTQVLSLPASGSTSTTTTTTTTTPPPAGANASASDSAKWFTLQKSFGPVYFEKVGVQYQDKTIWFLLSATLTAAGLSLSLDGLGVGGSLDKYMPPSFDLRGLGVGYKSGPVEISGAFLRQRVTQGGVTYDEYDGAALIKTEQLSLSAIGSYAYMDGHPSMFIYAVLDYPIGGPSFFFVTGLAAGFGFNRALVAPAIDQVAQFPLVAEAVAGAGMPTSLAAELQKLRQYIPPEVGEYFLAVGIKFTSFKLVDSFALLTVAFGRRFEIDLLGLSTLIVPTPLPGQSVTPLAEVQMAVRASYVPDDGFLGISAQLTSASFILSRDCHLTGGFAFWSWLAGEHEGDFVLTLGGYHPNYNVPAHYPKVPRLGFNWRVDSNISIKGGIYYALTASTLMAGGSLQATWESGSLKAWFNAGANFIIAWKPYHYDATMYVDIGVSYTYHFFGTHHLNVNVGADLHLWGPEFSGKAHIKLSVISFDVKFGSNSSQTARPIDWPTFKKSFLPADSQVCSLAVRDGLAKDSPDGWVVNPKEFTLVSNSVIPATEAYAGAAPIPGGGAALGLAPMAVGSYVARHTVRITKGGASCEDRFEFTPVRKKAPAAMWGRSFSPNLNGAAFVENALAGFEIRPKAKPQAGATAAIDPGVLQYSSESVPDAYRWEGFAEFVAGAGTDAERTQAIRDSLAKPTTADARSQLLAAFDMPQATVNVTAAAADAFLAAPQTGTLAA
jgi:hypothetical protein